MYRARQGGRDYGKKRAPRGGGRLPTAPNVPEGEKIEERLARVARILNVAQLMEGRGRRLVDAGRAMIAQVARGVSNVPACLDSAMFGVTVVDDRLRVISAGRRILRSGWKAVAMARRIEFEALRQSPPPPMNPSWRKHLEDLSLQARTMTLRDAQSASALSSAKDALEAHKNLQRIRAAPPGLPVERERRLRARMA